MAEGGPVMAKLKKAFGGQISNWKAATLANDSHNGVFCALAARHGMTGPVDVLSAASALSILNFRIKGLEFSTGILDFKLPIDPTLLCITGGGPRGRGRGELLGIAEAAIV